MLKHYIDQALRSFWRFRVTAAVNLLGLVLAVVCFIATYLYLDSLLRSDSHFPKASRIYAITQELWTGPSTIMVRAFPNAGPPVAKNLRADFPSLEAVARAVRLGTMAAATDDRKVDVLASAVDPEFFRIFDFDFKDGAPETALASTRSAVITERTAQRLFGTTHAVGRQMLIQNHFEVTVTGVIGAVPKPSHMGDSLGDMLWFDVLVPMDLPKEMRSNGNIGVTVDANRDDWWDDSYFTYVLLPGDGSLTSQELMKQLGTFAARREPKGPFRSVFGAVPLSHIKVADIDAQVGGGSLSLFASIFGLDVLILVIACLNYANLAVAIATTRAKEIGVRKVLGATRMHLVRQYLVEALLLGGAAIIIVLVLSALVIEPVNRAFQANLELSSLLNPGLWGIVLALIAAISLIGGAYPAFVLSRVRPVEALRSGAVHAGPRFVPTVLVGVQFAAASFLLVVALLMTYQNRMLQKRALQTDTDPVVVLGNNLGELGVSFDTLRGELLSDSSIKSVSAVRTVPWQSGGWHAFVTRDVATRTPGETTMFNMVGYHFFETLGLKMLAGRALDREHGDEFRDSSTPTPPGKEIRPVVIDRALATTLGWSDPNEAVNKVVFGPDLGPQVMSLRVVGVVEDGFPRLVGPNTTSNLYGLAPVAAEIALVRVSRQNLAAALRHIDATWESLVPKAPLRREFMDALFAFFYQSYANVSAVLTGLAAFAFFISVMGLCGLAIHVTSRRQREIGIRKTLGASAKGVVMMLLVDFAKPVLIANVIAWPFAYFVGRAYLNQFVQQTAVTVWPFMLSLVITLCVAWASVGFQALRAAAVKPANVLYAQ
jgi:putative ABC transport system permease protein